MPINYSYVVIDWTRQWENGGLSIVDGEHLQDRGRVYWSYKERSDKFHGEVDFRAGRNEG